MSGFRQYRVDPEVLKQARAIGMYGNVEARIARMARESVPHTHPQANRRFDGFLLKIDNGVVTRIMRFQPGVYTTQQASARTPEPQQSTGHARGYDHPGYDVLRQKGLLRG